MKIRLNVFVALAFVASSWASARSLPTEIWYGGQQSHVQGIAWDGAAERMYFSFTTRFISTDADGRLLGSIDRIHGHLGGMTFDAEGRKVYASLECKDDEIGSGISRKLGLSGYTDSDFYIAEIDVNAVDRCGTPAESAMRCYEVADASMDYRTEVCSSGRVLKHRFGCSGIDGITIGPGFGQDQGRYLYVAYGIYSDTTRTDNDYQVLLQYRLDDLSKPVGRYFVPTGNTTYGVQNLSYDPYTGMLFMAVYRGAKRQNPNYDMFAVDMSSSPRRGRLEGVDYMTEEVDIVDLAVPGWHFPHGSTGMCSIGDGLWYISEKSKTKTKDGIKVNNCSARLYRWTGSDEKPFEYVDDVTSYVPSEFEPGRKKQASMRVMSFNILQGKDEPKGHEWKEVRRYPSVNMLDAVRPDIVAVQEARRSQCENLEVDVPRYGQIKFPKDSVESHWGQRNLILYKKSAFKVLETGKFWFTADMTASGNPWGDTKVTQKMALYARMLDKKSKKEFWVFNVHFVAFVDSQQTRLRCSRLIARQIENICPEDATVILFGDMNIKYDKAYDLLEPIWRNGFMENVALVADSSDGPLHHTFNAFGRPGGQQTLDYIFIRNAHALSYKVIDGDGFGTRYISDHYPICSDIVF